MRLALFVIALAGAGRVSATTVVTTFTGTVYDAQGDIGAASPFGAIVAGQDTYKLVYTVRDSLPTATSRPVRTARASAGPARSLQH